MNAARTIRTIAGGALSFLCLWLSTDDAFAQALTSPANEEIRPPGEGMLTQPCPVLPSLPPLPLTEPGAPTLNLTPDWIAAYTAGANYQRRYDWPFLCRYASEDAELARSPSPPRAVFIGDSITESWARYDAGLFTNGVINRGITGQTTPQMLLRFYQDVVALHPRVVHIMAGSNDIAGITGPTSAEQFENNIRAMVDIALANHVHVVLASIPPSREFRSRPMIKPAAQIIALNTWLRAFAARQHLIFADYYDALSDADGGMRAEYTFDGLHPGTAGYLVMRPIAERAIAMATRGDETAGSRP